MNCSVCLEKNSLNTRLFIIFNAFFSKHTEQFINIHIRKEFVKHAVIYNI